MDWSYYAFAFFVFLLVCAAIVLSALAHKSSKKERLDMDEREKKLFRLYQDMEDMAAGFEDYVREAQEQGGHELERIRKLSASMADMLGEAQRQGQAARELCERLKAQGVIPAEEPAPEAEDFPGSPRSDLVVRLHQDGRNAEQIAKELGISRGEVALILGMKRNRS